VLAPGTPFLIGTHGGQEDKTASAVHGGTGAQQAEAAVGDAGAHQGDEAAIGDAGAHQGDEAAAGGRDDAANGPIVAVVAEAKDWQVIARIPILTQTHTHTHTHTYALRSLTCTFDRSDGDVIVMETPMRKVLFHAVCPSLSRSPMMFVQSNIIDYEPGKELSKSDSAIAYDSLTITKGAVKFTVKKGSSVRIRGDGKNLVWVVAEIEFSKTTRTEYRLFCQLPDGPRARWCVHWCACSPCLLMCVRSRGVGFGPTWQTPSMMGCLQLWRN